MAEIEDVIAEKIGGIAEVVSPGLDIMYILAIVVFGASVIYALIAWIRFERSFKHFIVIRIVTENRKRIMTDKFREFTDGDGVLWWKMRKRKHIIPVAPPDAIELTADGSIYVEAYYTPEGEYVFFSDKLDKEHQKDINSISWIVDSDNKEKIPYNDLFKEYLKNISEWNKLSWYQKINFPILWRWYVEKPEAPQLNGRYVYIRDSSKAIDSFQPLTTKQRLILVNQYKKAQERKKFSFWENLPQMAAIGAVVMILVIMLVFWEDVVGPAKEAMEVGLERDKVQLEASKLLHEIILEKQIIGQGQGTRALVGDEAPP